LTEDDALRAVGLLVGGIGGFNDDAVVTYTRGLMREDNAEAMFEVCDRLSRTWKGRFKPSLPEVLDEYQHHPDVAAEREMRLAEALSARGASSSKTCGGTGWVLDDDGTAFKPCFRCNPFLATVWMDGDKWQRWLQGTSLADLHDDLSKDRSGEMSAEYPMPQPCKPLSDRTEGPAPRRLTMAEGMLMAGDEFRSMYGRAMGDVIRPNPSYARDVIERIGTFDSATETWRTTYTEVAREFRFDHARCIPSIDGIGADVARDTHGHITLRRPPEAQEAAEAPWTPRWDTDPDRPAPSSLDPSGTLSGAIRNTITTLEAD
jgi:hypothetical protein